MSLHKSPPMHTVGDLMDANADLMSQVYSDPGLSPDEKLRSFTLGIRNQCALSRDLQSRRAELARYNLLQQAKVEDLHQLVFNPALAAPSASLPAPAADAADTPNPVTRPN